MNKILFLFVCCVILYICQAQSDGGPPKKWRAKKWKNSKRKWGAMKSYTEASWKTTINDIQVSESAKYRDDKDVVFMSSRDHILENLAIGYEKSFFIYDVQNSMGAIVVQRGKFCFIKEMDSTATMESVKAELTELNNTEPEMPKPLKTVYASAANVVTTGDLFQKSFMISAICSKAANCNRAYMVQSSQPQEEIKATWKTSGFYDRHVINMTFDPEEERQCKTWTNMWKIKKQT